MIKKSASYYTLFFTYFLFILLNSTAVAQPFKEAEDAPIKTMETLMEEARLSGNLPSPEYWIPFEVRPGKHKEPLLKNSFVPLFFIEKELPDAFEKMENNIFQRKILSMHVNKNDSIQCQKFNTRTYNIDCKEPYIWPADVGKYEEQRRAEIMQSCAIVRTMDGTPLNTCPKIDLMEPGDLYGTLIQYYCDKPPAPHHPIFNQTHPEIGCSEPEKAL